MCSIYIAAGYQPFNTVKMCPCNIGFWIKACVHKCSNQVRMCTNGKYFEWIFLFNCHTSLAVTPMLSLIRDTTHGLTLLNTSWGMNRKTWQNASITCGWVKIKNQIMEVSEQENKVLAICRSNSKCQVNLSLHDWVMCTFLLISNYNLSPFKLIHLILSQRWFQFKGRVTSAECELLPWKHRTINFNKVSITWSF